MTYPHKKIPGKQKRGKTEPLKFFEKMEGKMELYNKYKLLHDLREIRRKMGNALNLKYHFRVVLTLVFFIITCHFSLASAEELTLPKIESGKVMLHWTELKLLLEEIETLKTVIAQEKDKEKDKEDIPPAEYSISSAVHNGTIKGETGRFESDFSVQVLKEGWITIPFFPNDVGIETVRIEPVNSSPETASDNNRTPQFIRDENGYSLIAKGPAAFRIQAIFHIPVQIQNFIHTLTFLPPRSVINRMTIQIPEKGVRVIHTTPAGRMIQEENAAIFETILSERDTLKLSWKIEKDAGITRKKQAVLHSLASVEKSGISVFTEVILKHIASLDPIAFYLPPDVEIINVTSPDIERWDVKQTETSQIINVAGQTDPHASVRISLSYRIRLPSLPAKTGIPIIDIREIDMLEGFLGVEIIGNLEVTSEGVKNGIAIPAKNLPKALWNDASSPLLYGYEFHVNGFTPIFTIKSYQEIQTVVANIDRVDCVTHRTLAGKSVSRIRYFIRNNDRQFLTLTLPEKSRIWQAYLDGKPVKPAQKETGDILIPMKKSASQGEELRSFLIEIGYITDVSKLSLKGDIINQLPGTDIPVNYLKWRLYLPEYYGYTKFEGPLKQVSQFSDATRDSHFRPLRLTFRPRDSNFSLKNFSLLMKYLISKENTANTSEMMYFSPCNLFNARRYIAAISGKNPTSLKECSDRSRLFRTCTKFYLIITSLGPEPRT